MSRMLFGFPVWGKPGVAEFVCFVRNLYLVRSSHTEMEEGEV